MHTLRHTRFQAKTIVLFFLFLSLVPPNMLRAQDRKTDSLLDLFRREKDQKKKYQLCIQLSSRYLSQNITQSMYYSRLAFDLAVKQKDSLDIGDAANCTGNAFYMTGDFDKAREQYELSLRYYKPGLREHGRATAINNIGLTYINQGKYSKGLDFQLQSLTIYEQTNDTSGMLRTYNAIAVVYKELASLMQNKEDLEKALLYFRKSLGLNSSGKDSLGWINVLNNMGSTFQQVGKFDSAYSYLQRSYTLADKIRNPYTLSTSLGNLSALYFVQGLSGKAIEAGERCIRLKREINDQLGLAGMLILLAETYESTGNKEKAQEYLVEAITICEKIGAGSEQMKASRMLSTQYAAHGDYQRAWDVLSSYVKLKDTLSSTENKQIIQEFKGRFEIDNQKKQIELLEQKNQIGELKTARQNQMLTFIVIGFILVLIIAIVLYNRFRVKKKANSRLQEAYWVIEEKNKSITDSIRYAKHLQEAILPPAELISRLLPDSFILYKPKDIVAGDFYWVEEKNGLVFFAAADCTGHGVPGAMVSVVCSKALNSAINEFQLSRPGNILDKATEIVLDTFSRSHHEVSDGMDISLCCFDRTKNELYWAGANNPLWIFSGSGFREITPDKQPVGKAERRKPFTTHTVAVSPGDMIYLFTDGFADQFGGPKGKKFKYRQLQELLAKIEKEKLLQQREKLENAFDTWKGNAEQVDDVLVFGIRF